MSTARTAWGWGLASQDEQGRTLDVWYPKAEISTPPTPASRPSRTPAASERFRSSLWPIWMAR